MTTGRRPVLTTQACMLKTSAPRSGRKQRGASQDRCGRITSKSYAGKKPSAVKLVSTVSSTREHVVSPTVSLSMRPPVVRRARGAAGCRRQILAESGSGIACDILARPQRRHPPNRAERGDARMDSGTAYGRPTPSYDATLVEVGPGTPGGELLRRYWHPVAVAADATTRPQKVRVLGEDLILFRDGEGRPVRLYPRCCHLVTTLYYGKVEASGIRCCYHGWLFDVEGRCLDMPCEPSEKNLSPRYRETFRQPWYPVQEYLGLLFAYMGPPEKKPVLPRYDVFEDVPVDEEIVADGNNIGLAGDTTPCNWLQKIG